MKEKSKRQFLYHQKTLKNWLFEQEDVFDTETPEDEPSEEEEAAETEAEGEEGAAGAAEEATDEEEDEGEEEIEIEPADEVRLSKSVDQDLEALFLDFEMQARKSKEIEHQQDETTIQIESLSLKFLTEQDAPAEYTEELDLERFSSEVARLVKNYTSLLDMEKMLVNKAREFVITRYGEEAEKDLLNILGDKHDIDVVSPNEPPTSELETPTAVGAGAGGAGGAV